MEPGFNPGNDSQSVLSISMACHLSGVITQADLLCHNTIVMLMPGASSGGTQEDAQAQEGTLQEFMRSGPQDSHPPSPKQKRPSQQ